MPFEESKATSNEEFFKDSFEIDDYLSKSTHKGDLLTLRNDLKQMGQVIYAEMIDILKYETDNIVNLAENLTTLSTKIYKLVVPVAQLKEEIRGLHSRISSCELACKQQFNMINAQYTKRSQLNLRMGFVLSLNYIKTIIDKWDDNCDITILERAVNEYSFHHLRLKYTGFEEIVKEDFVASVVKELVDIVHKVFFKGLTSDDTEVILKCLSMYENLEKQREAENFVKEILVRPVLLNIFTQNNLDKNNNNMQALYKEAISCLNVTLKTLLSVLDKNPDLKKFNFIINSFWVEVDKQLRENLPNITAPGNPDLFRSRYNHTREFFEQIIAITKTSSLIQTDPSFEAHLKRFNLAVYLEIRFQQIAAKLETELLMDPTSNDKIQFLKNSNFMLNISSTLLSCIQRCLHEEVYIVQLSDQFFKLIMLLVSRYVTWYETAVKWPNTVDGPACNQLEKFVMYTLKDIIALKKSIGFSNNVSTSTLKIIPSAIQPLFLEISIMNSGLLDSLDKKLQDGIVVYKIRHCITFLKQVSSIPRIYRRTNRDSPQERSSYITETVLLLTDFYHAYKDVGCKTVSILDLIIEGVSDRYIELVLEVLKSVGKTEESLKRLKNRSTNSSDDSSGSGSGQGRGVNTSDESKIRKQIKLDVRYYAKELQQFSKDTSKSSLKALLKVSGAKI